ncbi:hypothetical protein [Streptomyces sp. MBT53]|uniref:hypothetical protein n=1 Tax=Streptomyces sp. MBT53 TaxID=1488384 RepID=UPI001911C19B|nr:hypothetical protein [Streptomyces sp. MBT53]MBK6014168.1 hypothetical protein [Streptomyces sp. MBT53]
MTRSGAIVITLYGVLVRADIAPHAPEADLPVLVIEVDRCAEADEVRAAEQAKQECAGRGP